MFELTEANYNFDPVKFNVDESLGDHIMEPFPNKSFFWVICGKPGSGKTSLLINTLISKGQNRVYRKVFDKILLVMPSNSRASLKNSPFEDLPDDQQFEKFDENVVNRIMAIRDEFGGKKKEEPIKRNKIKEDIQDVH
jgi:GTPase SAR1 family protein